MVGIIWESICLFFCSEPDSLVPRPQPQLLIHTFVKQKCGLVTKLSSFAVVLSQHVRNLDSESNHWFTSSREVLQGINSFGRGKA